MATPAQLTANRANAQSSTGPRSVEGKAAASRNSLKLGLYAQSMIIPGEDPDELEELSAAYHQQWEPVGPIEIDLVHDIIRAAWMKRRYRTLDAQVLNSRVANLPEDTPYLVGAAMIYDSTHGDTLGKINRRLLAAQRDWDRALQALTHLQVIRRRVEDQAKDQAEVEEFKAPLPTDRVRFSAHPQSPALHTPEPPVNLALHL